jgi:hypothetical protein
MATEATLDLHSFVDPSPIMEQEVLKKAYAQLELVPIFEQLTTSLGKAAKHLKKINESVR